MLFGLQNSNFCFVDWMLNRLIITSLTNIPKLPLPQKFSDSKDVICSFLFVCL